MRGNIRPQVRGTQGLRYSNERADLLVSNTRSKKFFARSCIASASCEGQTREGRGVSQLQSLLTRERTLNTPREKPVVGALTCAFLIRRGTATPTRTASSIARTAACCCSATESSDGGRGRKIKTGGKSQNTWLSFTNRLALSLRFFFICGFISRLLLALSLVHTSKWAAVLSFRLS